MSEDMRGEDGEGRTDEVQETDEGTGGEGGTERSRIADGGRDLADHSYDDLGVTRVVNANFPSTVLGGSSLPEKVFDAASEANDEYAWLWDLQERAGEIIADITGAEAAHVTTGTYGGLVVSAAACMAGTDRERMASLPVGNDETKREFIVQRCLRWLKYDRAITTAGGTFVPVGDESGCTVDAIEDAITDRTAGIHYFAPGPGEWPGPTIVKGNTPESAGAKGAVPLETVIDIAHRNDVPVIVDAAGQTYPIEGLSRYVEMGADLVCYSGKYFEGPNAAGFVAGRRDLVEAVFHNNFLGGEGYAPKRPTDVEYLPDDVHTSHNAPRSEHGPNRTYGIGRGYKLDRFDVVATVVALQRWVEMDHEAVRFAPARERAEFIIDECADLSGVTVEPGEYDYHFLPLTVTFEGESAEYVDTITETLFETDPVVWPREILVTDAGKPQVTLNLLWLRPGDETVIADRLVDLGT